ncbi:MAG: lytic transglycosylase domain-containing protein [Myxococcaceae bacterium]|nr:lytic transglycosylase domain-containing protein [Myxococcaceae bacterium]
MVTALLLASTLAAPPAFLEEIDAAIADARAVYPVPQALVRAVMQQESGNNPKALSPVGAIGLMQVMPFNATKLGLAGEKELWVPRLNILAGVRLLAALLKHYEGDVVAALVAYNSGPKAPRRVPDNGETPQYVVNILALYKRFLASGGADAGVPSAPR